MLDEIFSMTKSDLLSDILSNYTRHDWQLRRLLLTAKTINEVDDTQLSLAPVSEASFDALWFSRPSRGDREAWELRLLAATPYALFENFEPDETEEQREEMRQEMEARLRDHLQIS